jgi:two-component system nitrogen regulation sensor histidine kinase NtrY
MTTRVKGTGLGLAIVQRITEQHGGTLHLADAPKKNGKIEGASVRLDLPMNDREEALIEDGGPERTAAAPVQAAKAEATEEEEGVTHGV